MNRDRGALSDQQLGALALAAAGLPVFRCCCAVSWPWVLLGGAAAALTLSALSRAPGRFWDAIAFPAAGLLALGALAAAWGSSFSFPETAGKPLAAALVLGLGTAAARRGAEAAGRCAGILLWLTGALYGIVLIFSLPQLRPDRLRPAGTPADALRVWASLLPSGAALCLRRESGGGKALRWPWWASAAAALSASLVTGGILSPALASEPESFRTLARGVSVLGVIRRFEALVNGAMLMSGFCLCALLLTAAGSLIQGKNAGKRPKKFFEKMQKKC